MKSSVTTTDILPRECSFTVTGFSINTKSQLLQLRFLWIITHDLNLINLNRIFLALKIASLVGVSVEMVEKINTELERN